MQLLKLLVVCRSIHLAQTVWRSCNKPTRFSDAITFLLYFNILRKRFKNLLIMQLIHKNIL